MTHQKNRLLNGILFIPFVFFSLYFFSSCNQKQKGDEIKQAADLIKEYAVRSNPALKGKRLKANISIDGGFNADGVCACIVVCDAYGGNCTSCTCSPANCGTCK